MYLILALCGLSIVAGVLFWAFVLVGAAEGNGEQQ